MALMIRLLILLLLTTTATADIYCYDGDTCYVNREPIRLLGVDTPEIRGAKCGLERIKALEARDFLNDTIDNAKEVAVHVSKVRGHYGRMLGYVYVDGENMSDVLIRKGYGVKYDMYNKEDWCK